MRCANHLWTACSLASKGDSSCRLNASLPTRCEVPEGGRKDHRPVLVAARARLLLLEQLRRADAQRAAEYDRLRRL